MAEDEPFARQSMIRLLDSAEDIVVVGEATDGAGAIELAESGVGQPDVILVDVGLPTVDGIEVTRRLRQEHPDVGVIILSAYEDTDRATEAVRAGAKAYVQTTAQGPEVLDTVRMVAHGHAVLSARVWDTLAEAPTPGEQFGLTERDMDVLRLIGRGYRNLEVAQRLAISPSTVKWHVERILRCLNATDRTEAVLKALRLRIID